MSISVPPPEFQFTNLQYNPNFWTSATSPLTQDVADDLYLQKTVPDSASALETFNAGIRTSTANPLTTNGVITIASSATPAATINIGTSGAPQTLNMNRPMQLQYFKSSITTSSLGYNVISPSSSGPTGMSAGATTNIATLTVTQGVWIMFGTCTALMAGVPSYGYFQLSIGTGAALDYTACSTILVINGQMTFQVTRFHSADTSQTYYLLANSQYAANAENIKFNAYRIG